MSERVQVEGSDKVAPVLSDGSPSILKTWHGWCVALFGDDSPATKMIADKMSDQGWDEPVVSDEAQLLHALGQIHFGATT